MIVKEGHMARKYKKLNYRLYYSKRNQVILLSLLVILFLTFITYGYGLLNTVLSINTDFAVRPERDIRIVSIIGPNYTNGAYETTEYQYSHDFFAITGVLPNTDSTIEYTLIVENKTDVTVYIHHYIREDEELFYGFGTKDERELFRLLIGVSGIGAATARMMLSSLSAEEIRNAIIAEDIARIKSIKGIGLKSAQRLILELKDKVIKGTGGDISGIVNKTDNGIIDEATTALILLGFSKANVQKAITAILKENPQISLENLIKAALKKL